MKVLALVNPGLEKLCRQEVKEILKMKATLSEQVAEFTVKDASSLLLFLFRCQSARRILLSLGTYPSLEDLDFSTLDFPWKEIFPDKFSFKVEVEKVKGMDNRIEIAKKVAGKVFRYLEQQIGVHPALELKKPDFLVIVYKTEGCYYLGLDLAGQELNSREYRLFTHQASMKGDLAYFFVRTSGYKPGEKLLVGFVRDGTFAIEAALYATRSSLSLPREKLSFRAMPLFSSLSDTMSPSTTTPVYAIDEQRPNLVAAKKNAKLAGVEKSIELYHFAPDELEVMFKKGEFDRLLFQLTKRDEKHFTSVIHGATQVLRKGGTLMIISTAQVEFPTPHGFVLCKHGVISRGDNQYRWWLLERK